MFRWFWTIFSLGAPETCVVWGRTLLWKGYRTRVITKRKTHKSNRSRHFASVFQQIFVSNHRNLSLFEHDTMFFYKHMIATKKIECAQVTVVRIQLFRERLSEKMCWLIRCSWHCSCRIFYCCFPLALANIRLWPLVPFFQISLKNNELKTTQNTFRDCRVHFFRQPFSK